MADGASAPVGKVVKTEDQYVLATWATGALGGLATGTKVALGRIMSGSMSIQAVGTWGSATLVLAGSNDGTTWKTCYLMREQTAAGKQDLASFTADDGGKVTDDAFRYYRISTSGGTSTNLTAYLLARR